jgi:hypothetical protein
MAYPFDFYLQKQGKSVAVFLVVMTSKALNIHEVSSAFGRVTAELRSQPSPYIIPEYRIAPIALLFVFVISGSVLRHGKKLFA